MGGEGEKVGGGVVVLLRFVLFSCCNNYNSVDISGSLLWGFIYHTEHDRDGVDKV